MKSGKSFACGIQNHAWAMESGISPTIGVRNPTSTIRDWNSVPGIRKPWRGIWMQDILGFPNNWVEYANNVLSWSWSICSSYFHPLFFLQLHLVVSNSMLPVAMLIVCVICHKRSNGRPRGVYLILRVQEGSFIDGKQLKDRGVYSYKRKQLNKTNILLSKISRAFKNCGISSPYFWYI